jgi:hypothetical protein
VSLEFLEGFRIRPIGRLPYSQGLAPSDFDLFGKLKGAFAAREFGFTEEFLVAIKEATGSIERAELESVFDAWERRLGQCIQMKGKYVS